MPAGIAISVLQHPLSSHLLQMQTVRVMISHRVKIP